MLAYMCDLCRCGLLWFYAHLTHNAYNVGFPADHTDAVLRQMHCINAEMSAFTVGVFHLILEQMSAFVYGVYDLMALLYGIRG